MDTTAKWFTEEQKLFVKNKALVDKAIEKAEFERDTDGGSPTLHSKALSEISQLETELKKTIYNHSRLIGETTELSQLSDQIINRAKLRKLRPVFDFKQALNTIMKLDQPDLLAHVLEPLFAYLEIAQKQYEDPAYQGYYNVGPDETDCVTTGDLVDLFVEKWGEGMKWVNQYDGGPHEANFLKLDCSKLKTTFGWKPRWTVSEALDKTVEWTKVYFAGESVADIMDKQIKEFLNRK